MVDLTFFTASYYHLTVLTHFLLPVALCGALIGSLSDEPGFVYSDLSYDVDAEVDVDPQDQDSGLLQRSDPAGV